MRFVIEIFIQLETSWILMKVNPVCLASCKTHDRFTTCIMENSNGQVTRGVKCYRSWFDVDKERHLTLFPLLLFLALKTKNILVYKQ